MDIQFEVRNGIAVITLNRPEKKNAMLLAMRDHLVALCEQINDDPEIRVAILTGNGKDFCAGADIGEMGSGGVQGSLLKARHMNGAISALGRLQKPLVGAVSGVALGMGLSMALVCDVVVATNSLRMGAVQRKIGLCPDAGNVWFLSRYLGVQKAKEIVFSARMIDAQEALALGLISRIAADLEVFSEAMAIAETFSTAPTLALGIAKRMFSAAPSMTLEQFMDLEGSLVPLIAQSLDFREGTQAFLEKRSPEFVGN